MICKRDLNAPKSCATCMHFRPEHNRCRAYHRPTQPTEGHACAAWLRIFQRTEVKP